MRSRGILLTCAALAALVAGLVGGGVARAAPSAPSTVFGPPHELSKVTLGETSIDGPGLWTSGSDSVKAVMTWTGTDPSHLLNVMTSQNGMQYGRKITLAESSFVRPAVTRMSDAAGGVVSVAWTGTNAGRSLNVLFDVYGSRQKLTLWNESSFTSPALVMFRGNLLLAWAGTDPVHMVNVLPISIGRGLVPGQKVTLKFYNSVARPSLNVDSSQPAGTGRLILAWTGTSLAHWIRFALSTDGVNWTQPENPVIGELSDSGPSMAHAAASNMPQYWLAWTGTDPLHSVNVRYTESFPDWPLNDTKSTLRETALGGPIVGYAGVNRQVIVAWAGTDPSHHLNVATIGV